MFLRTLQRVFAVVAIACLAWFAWESRGELHDLVQGAMPLYLLGAVVLWCATHLLSPVAAMLVLDSADVPVHYRVAAGIHARNLPARYVPGGIWHTVGRVAAFGSLGVGAKDLSRFVVIENVLAAATALAIGGIATFTIRGADTWGLITAAGAVAGIAVTVSLPFLLRTRWLKGDVELSLQRYWALVVFACVYWLTAAAAFVTYVHAYASLAAQAPVIEAGAAYLFSWGVGFIAVFAPQGIGVFELVAAELMRDSGSLTGVAALIAGFRVVVLLADALLFLAAQIVFRDNGTS